jgi:serine protease Do
MSKNTLSRRLIAFATFTVLACLCMPAAAQDGKKEKALYVRLLHSSTWVVVPRPAKPGAVSWHEGSGWVVDAKRKLIVTNCHVVGNARDVQVFFPYYVNNQALTARKPYVNLIAQGGGSRGNVIAFDRERDLALIQLGAAPNWIKSLPIAARGVSAGERVYNLGNPGGDSSLWQFSASAVLNVGQRELKSKIADGGEMKIRGVIIETDDAKARRGQSGSLVVNPRGELVGVVQSTSHAQPQTTMLIERSEVLQFLKTHQVQPHMAADK